MESRALLTDEEKDHVIKAQLFSMLREAIYNSGVAIQASNQRFIL
jgi:hypothetical protein